MTPVLQDHLLWDVAAPILTGVVLAIIGFIIGRLVTQRDRASAQRDKANKALAAQQEALKGGMTALLRWELIGIHKEYVIGKGFVPLEVKEQADDVYVHYHALGGNGTGTRLHDEIMNCHIAPSKKGLAE